MERKRWWIHLCLMTFFVLAGFAAELAAQGGQVAINGRLLKYDGMPRQGTLGMTFTLYSSKAGGDVLWREDRVVQTDEQGRYNVGLGSTEQEGLMSDLLVNGTVLWLGIQVQGEEELERVELNPNSYDLREARARLTKDRPPMTFAVSSNPVNLERRHTLAGANPSSTNKGTGALASGGSLGPFAAHESDLNTWFGQSSGLGPPSDSGNQDSFFGAFAGHSTTTGTYNAFVGAGAGSYNVEGSRNTYVGALAGEFALTSDNSFFGYEAGGDINLTGSPNSFFGSQAGANNSSGSHNTFIGYKAGIANTTGLFGTAVGDNAGSSLYGTVSSNVFLGYQAGRDTQSGGFNVFVGTNSGQTNVTGTRNTFIGHQAGQFNQSGDYNTFVGLSAGSSNTAESYNTSIGYDSDVAAGITNATAIGTHAKVTQSNSLVLGSINTVNGAAADVKVGIGTTAPVSTLNVRSTTNVSPRGVTNEQYNDGMDGVQFRGRKARGTLNSPTAVQMGDVLGNYVFDGHDGTAFGTGVQIRPVTEEAWTSTAHGAYLALWTTTPGTTTNSERLRITGAGNVGIGTTTPSEKLHVVGNIRATGMIYSSPSPGSEVPDYVFESDYNLMPIAQLEKYIAQEKRLPNIPKASEIKENGLNHTEFQLKLLEKIEELTLYTVHQARTIEHHESALAQKDEEIATLKSQKDVEVSALKSQNAALDSRLAALEQMLERLTKKVEHR